MNKCIKLISVLISVILLFCGCTSADLMGGKSSITLTTENASDYLTFSLHGGGGNPDYSSSYGIVYHSVEAYGDISGINGYEYDNVNVTLKFNYKLTPAGNYDNENYDIITDPIPLNVGGYGVVNVSERTNKNTYYKFYESDVECLGYEIISITGTVKPI